jgi:type IV pilus assembly protein PilC
MKKKYLSNYYHSLAMMLEAGVPILKALRTASTTGGRRYQSELAGLEANAARGNGLSESMSNLPNIFLPMDIELVHTAEISGNLPEVLQQLSAWYGYQASGLRKLKSGLVFPTAILILAVIISPLSMLFLGHITSHQYISGVFNTLGFLAAAVCGTIAIVQWTPPDGLLRKILDFLVLKIPLLGPAMKYLSLSRYFLAFHIMLKSGVPMIQTTQLTERLTGNYFIGRWFRGCLEAVRAGHCVSEGFSASVPNEYRQLWETGEETGNLDDVCLKLYDKTSELSAYWLNLFVAWLPKVVYAMVCMYIIYQIGKGFAAISSRMGQML